MSELRDNYDKIAHPQGGNMTSYSALVDFPSTGSIDTFYRDKSNNKLYIWSGSAYTEIGSGGGGGGGGGGGQVDTVVAGNNIDVDNTDPVNPIVSASGLDDLKVFQGLLPFLRLPFSGTVSDIPTGWELATELIDSFILGSAIADIGDTGGNNSVTIAQANLPDYDLTVTDPGHAHSLGYSTAGGATGCWPTNGATADMDVDSATTGITVNSGGTGQALNIIPKYYKLAWIKKST